MLLFSQKGKKKREAQGLLVKILNNNCPQMLASREGPRTESRLAHSMPVFVVPMVHGQPDIAAAFATVTREISMSGMSVVLTEPLAGGEVMLGVRLQTGTEPSSGFFLAELRHQTPIGAGIWHAGFEVTEVVYTGDYPKLSSLRF